MHLSHPTEEEDAIVMEIMPLRCDEPESRTESVEAEEHCSDGPLRRQE
jgi:hypothetical protein